MRWCGPRRVSFSSTRRGASSPRAGTDGMVRVFDAQSGGDALSLPHHAPITAMAWHPSESLLATAEAATDDGEGRRSITLWRPRDRRSAHWPTRVLALRDSVIEDPDGRRALDDSRQLVIAGSGREVTVFDGDTIAARFKADTFARTAMAFHMASGRLVVADSRGRVTVHRGDRTTALEGLVGHVTHVAMSPDGQRVAASTRYGTDVWNAETGAGLFSNSELTDAGPRASLALISPTRLVEGRAHHIDVWDLERQAKLHTIAGDMSVVSADGSRMAAAGAGSPRVTLYDLSDGTAIRHFEAPAIKTTAIAMSQDAELLFVGTAAGVVWIFDVAGRVPIATFAAHDRAIGRLQPQRGAIVTTTVEPFVSARWDLTGDRRSDDELAARLEAVAPWTLRRGVIAPR